ncbi:hypothetical protein PV325_005458 [Microctonus aethiopoides]|nr:hypothetical protein PV325_005458 [Microctonus aethiopoides]
MPKFCDRCCNPMNLENHKIQTSLRKCSACYKKLLNLKTVNDSDKSETEILESFEYEKDVRSHPIDVDDSQVNTLTGVSLNISVTDSIVPKFVFIYSPGFRGFTIFMSYGTPLNFIPGQMIWEQDKRSQDVTDARRTKQKNVTGDARPTGKSTVRYPAPGGCVHYSMPLSALVSGRLGDLAKLWDSCRSCFDMLLGLGKNRCVSFPH